MGQRGFNAKCRLVGNLRDDYRMLCRSQKNTYGGFGLARNDALIE